MPLDEREQRILAEIERQFYEEDPQLAHAVRNITKTKSVVGTRLAVLGLLAGALIMFLTFTRATWLAAIGFVLMVLSATAVVQTLRHRDSRAEGDGAKSGRFADWAAGLKDKWRFRRS